MKNYLSLRSVGSKNSMLKILATVAVLGIYQTFSSNEIQAQSNPEKEMMGKRVEDPDKSYINVFPSGVYISSHGLSTLLPGIDQKSCKILYKEYGASILEDEKGIYKVYQVRKEDDWTTIPDVVGDTIKEKDYTLQGGKGFLILSLQGVDRKSFEVINEDVAFDKNKVYHMNIDIDHDSDDDKAGLTRDESDAYANLGQLDTKTAKTKPLTGGKYPMFLLADKDEVYLNARIKISGADYETFDRFGGEDRGWDYFHDKNNIYIWSWAQQGSFKVLCKNTGDQVRFLGRSYLTDGISVFFGGVKIDGADPKTFKIKDIPNSIIYADEKNVWIELGYLIQFIGADPKTFEHIETDQGFFFKDSKHVRISFGGQPLAREVDAKSFKLLEVQDPLYTYEDKNAYYDKEGKRYPKK